MEEFAIHQKNLDRFNMPEDELETAQVTAVKKREREFASEGRYFKMLGLKVGLEVLSGPNSKGILNVSHDTSRWIEGVIHDPKTYAYADLGVDMNKKDISEAELEERTQQFLKKQKPRFLKEIDSNLATIREYATREKSVALTPIEHRLTQLKELLSQDKWLEFTRELDEIREYTRGMYDLLRLTLGNQYEDNTTLEYFKVSPEK